MECYFLIEPVEGSRELQEEGGKGEVEASVQVHAKQTKAYKAAGQRGSQRLAARRVPRGGQGATQSKGHANAVIYATLTALQHSPVAGSRYALEAFVACNVQCKDWVKWQTAGCCSCCCRKRRVGCAFFGLF